METPMAPEEKWKTIATILAIMLAITLLQNAGLIGYDPDGCNSRYDMDC